MGRKAEGEAERKEKSDGSRGGGERLLYLSHRMIDMDMDRERGRERIN